MCYEFDTYYTKARVAEQLRKKAQEQERRNETPAPARPGEGEKQTKPAEPVPA